MSGSRAVAARAETAERQAPTMSYRHVQDPKAPASAWASELAKSSVQAHVDSFNVFVRETLPRLVASVEEFEGQVGDSHVRVWLADLTLSKPTRKDDCIEPRVFPTDARQSHSTYGGDLYAKLAISINRSQPSFVDNISLGEVPIMVSSSACHLSGLSPEALVRAREDPDERGGYFIVNGNEKVVRLLVQMKANFPSAIIRPSFASRGPLYTKFAVQMRCVKEDLTHTQTVTMHYRKDGSCFLRFSINKNEYLLPLLLLFKALNPNDRCSDEELFARLTDGVSEDAFVSERVLAMMEAFRENFPDIRSSRDALRHLGQVFASAAGSTGPSGSSGLVSAASASGSVAVGSRLVRRHLLVHVDSFAEKQLVLIVMFRKLMALVRGEIRPDNPDTTDNHDVLLPGHIFGLIVKEAVEVSFEKALGVLAKKASPPTAAPAAVAAPGAAPGASGRGSAAMAPVTATLVAHTIRGLSEVGKKLAYFLSTGNLASRSGLDLQQTTGFTIIADRLNAFRFFSHFRSIHRGAFFTEMKTTTVRKLFPETWGFLCPVHTPDGGPCGLLNHLTQTCRVTTSPVDEEARTRLIKELVAAGMTKLAALQVAGAAAANAAPASVLPAPVPSASTHVWVMVDGRVAGKLPLKLVSETADRVRRAKREGRITQETEVVAVNEHDKTIGLFPGLFLFTGPGRLTRPVKALADGKTEWVGPMEQIHMAIALPNEATPAPAGAAAAAAAPVAAAGSKAGKQRASASAPASASVKAERGAGSPPGTGGAPAVAVMGENVPVQHTHEEQSVAGLFSYLAALTPYSNHNQSPRNMYQCQMLKQTMGTPYLSHAYRTDNKTYKIQYPQAPMVRTETFSKTNLDVKPFGCNAVIAVIAHSGYDMEDALIINKASYNRGFGHAVVHKQKLVEGNADGAKRRFHGPTVPAGAAGGLLEADGLPRVGGRVKEGSSLVSAAPVAEAERGKPGQVLEKWKEDEEGWVEQVNVISGGGFGSLGDGAQRVSVKIRVPRNPVVGDKFASRHGQKGVMAMLYPQEDMPFTSISGITPDILFNPHGFPSRMTIGMLIETMAGKAAALEGRAVVDATPFRGGAGMAHEEAGRVLAKHGFHCLGTEQLYSGKQGVPIEVQIFCGVVYYQRLRHMVLDKAQVRATGPIDPLTKQPVKGRKRHGGIRFGEMERDSIISHGGAFLLKDRLLECSDKHNDFLCTKCGSILGVVTVERDAKPVCITCTPDGALGGDEAEESVQPVQIPFVFRYLSAELASMNIKLRLNLNRNAHPDKL